MITVIILIILIYYKDDVIEIINALRGKDSIRPDERDVLKRYNEDKKVVERLKDTVDTYKDEKDS